MFLTVVFVPIYLLSLAAMCFMDSLYKALMFLLMMLIVTFLLFLFIRYPFQSTVGVSCIISLFAFKMKD